MRLLKILTLLFIVVSSSSITGQTVWSGTTERVSVSSDGEQGNGSCWEGAISADGQFIVFTSDADNLVPDDTNGAPDVFVHDRLTRIFHEIYSLNGQK